MRNFKQKMFCGIVNASLMAETVVQIRSEITMNVDVSVDIQWKVAFGKNIMFIILVQLFVGLNLLIWRKVFWFWFSNYMWRNYSHGS